MKQLNGAQLSLREITASLFRRRLLMITTFITIASGVAIFAWITPDQYESEMKILVKNTRADVVITPEQTIASSGGTSDGEVSEAQINSELELLTSRDLLSRAAEECGLAKRKPSLLARLGISDAGNARAGAVEAATNQLAKDLSVTPVKKANIIELKYSSDSPQLAATVLVKIRDLYLEKHLKLHRPPGTYDFFKTQAAEYSNQLKSAEGGLSNFQQKMNVVSLSQQKDLAVQKMTDAKVKYMDAVSQANEASARIDKLQQQYLALPPRIVTQSRTLPNQYSIERMNTLLVELQNKRTELLTRFRPEDRLVREVEQQIKTTENALEHAKGQTAVEQSTDLNPIRQGLEAELSKARTELAGAQARQTTLAGQIKEYQAQLDKFEGITSEYDDRSRQVKDAEANYQLYVKKQEEARIADALDEKKITNVTIAEEPAVPFLPTKPNRLITIMMGLAAGLIVGMGGAFATELTRSTFDTPAELEGFMGLRVLATVPDSGLGELNPKQIDVKATRRLGSAEAGDDITMIAEGTA
jgi:uncharacterized protein involved in exopolysaccharide biosynthesis